MDELTRQQVSSNLSWAMELREKIKTGEKYNYRVYDNDFLTPTVGEVAPLEDPRGEFYYYGQIAEAMSAALKVGAIPAQFFDYVLRAPRNIANLVERPDDRVA